MAKVKITGHASGTGVITVTAPNTSTDRTITLPDATGALLTSADIVETNLTATSNIGLGTGAVDSITTGTNNVGVGDDALTANTTGAENVAFGKDALKTNTTGSQNAAFGRYALLSSTTASNNTGIGRAAMSSVTTGANNTALGYVAGDNITTGSSNIIIGSAIDATSATADNQLNIGGWIKKDSGTFPDGNGIGIIGSGGFQVFQVNAGNMTLADDAVYTMTGLLNTGAMIAVGSRHQGDTSVTYAHGLFMASYASGSSTLIADSNNTFANSDTDGKVCCYSSSGNANCFVKNRLGLTTWISIAANQFTGN